MTEIQLLADPSRQLQKADLVYMVDQMARAFGRDYFDPESPEYMRCELIFEACVTDNWTREEFYSRIRSFIVAQRYPKWQVADFLDYPAPAVYNHRWYTDQVFSGVNPASIGFYDIGLDKPVYGFVADIGDSLPRWTPRKVGVQQ